ncbi:hypothetical protein TRFO_06986 [Tritrichomonas foetus]|uniref:Uncharacterized protein n=1 Tax=Tritrichomonas foetus TaxID=1144522 RepID=A0A1J4JUB0_9EUKA|nr:hypothetical protein TRFO_06986 [Tritrichomonas foetus]|eukprot:OHT02587.1 hypothetical protein TRFO_06986 [Tritrichomonas foetus]
MASQLKSPTDATKFKSPDDQFLYPEIPDSKRIHDNIHQLTTRISELQEEKNALEQKVYQEVMNAPADEKKDLLIKNLQNELENQKSSNVVFTSKMAHAIEKIEDLLNIQNEEQLDLYDRIIGIGSAEYGLQESLKLQLYDVLERESHDYDLVHDILLCMKDKLETATMAKKSISSAQDKVGKIHAIAFGTNSDSETLRNALKDSIEIHQNADSQIKMLRDRISDLQKEIQYLSEHRHVADDSDVSSNSSLLSTLSLMSPKNISTSDSIRYHKPKSSINTKNDEEIDPYALTRAIRQEVEAEFYERMNKLQTELSDAKAKAALASTSQISLDKKIEKLTKENEELTAKYKKLYALHNDKKIKIEDMTSKLNFMNSKIMKLTGKSGIDMHDESVGQVKKLQNELETTKVEINKANEKCKKLELIYQKLTTNLKASKEQVELLQKKLNDSVNENNKNKSIIETLKKEIQTLKKSNMDLKSQLNTTTDSLQKENEKLKNDNQIYMKNLEDCGNNGNKLKSQNSVLLNCLNDLRSQMNLQTIDFSAVDNSSLQQIINSDLTNKINQLNKTNEERENDFIKLNKMFGIIDTSNEKTEGKPMQNILEQIEVLQKEKEDLQQQMDKLKSEIGINPDVDQNNESKTNNSSPKSNRMSLIEEVMKFKNDNTIMKQALHELRKCVSNHKTDETQSNDDLNSEPRDFCNSLICEINQIVKEHDDIFQNLGTIFENPKDQHPNDVETIISCCNDMNESNTKLSNILSTLLKTTNLFDSEKSNLENKNFELIGEHLQQYFQELQSSQATMTTKFINQTKEFQKIINSITGTENQENDFADISDNHNNDDVISNASQNLIQKLNLIKQDKEKLNNELTEIKHAVGISIQDQQPLDKNMKSSDPTKLAEKNPLSIIESKMKEIENMKNCFFSICSILGLTPSQEIKHDSMIKTIEKIKRENIELTQQMNQMKDDLGIPKANDDKKTENKSQPNNNISLTVKSLSHENKEMKAQNDNICEILKIPKSSASNPSAINNRIQDILAENSSLKQLLSTLQQSILKLSGNANKHGDQSKAFENIEDFIQNEINDIHNKLLQEQSEKENYKNEIQDIHNKLLQEQNEKESCKNEIQDIHNKLLQEQNEKESCKNEIQDIHNKLLQEQNEKENYKNKIQDIHNKLLQEQNEKESYKNELCAMKKALGIEIENEMSSSSQPSDDKQSQREQSKLSSIESVIQAKSEHENMKTAMHQICDMLNLPTTCKDDPSHINSRIQELLTENNTVKEKMQNLQQSILKLSGKNKIDDDQSKTFENIEDFIQHELNELDHKLQEANNEKENMMKDLCEMKKALGIEIGDEDNGRLNPTQSISFDRNEGKPTKDSPKLNPIEAALLVKSENENLRILMHQICDILNIYKDNDSKVIGHEIINKIENIKNSENELNNMIETSSFGNNDEFTPSSTKRENSIQEKVQNIMKEINIERTQFENILHNLLQTTDLFEDVKTNFENKEYEKIGEHISKYIQGLQTHQKALQSNIEELMSVFVPDSSIPFEINSNSLDQKEALLESVQKLKSKAQGILNENEKYQNEHNELKEILSVQTESKDNEDLRDLIVKQISSLKDKEKEYHSIIEEKQNMTNLLFTNSNTKKNHFTENNEKPKDIGDVIQDLICENELYNKQTEQIKSALGITSENEKLDLVELICKMQEEKSLLENQINQIFDSQTDESDVDSKEILANISDNNIEYQATNKKAARSTASITDKICFLQNKINSLENEKIQNDEILKKIKATLGIEIEYENAKDIDEVLIAIEKVKAQNEKANSVLNQIKESLDLSDNSEEFSDIFNNSDLVNKIIKSIDENKNMRKHIDVINSELGISFTYDIGKSPKNSEFDPEQLNDMKNVIISLKEKEEKLAEKNNQLNVIYDSLHLREDSDITNDREVDFGKILDTISENEKKLKMHEDEFHSFVSRLNDSIQEYSASFNDTVEGSDDEMPRYSIRDRIIETFSSQASIISDLSNILSSHLNNSLPVKETVEIDSSNELTAKVKYLLDSTEVFQQENSELQQQNDVHKKEIEELNKTISLKDVELNKSNIKIHELQNECENNQKEINELNNQLKELQRDFMSFEERDVAIDDENEINAQHGDDSSIKEKPLTVKEKIKNSLNKLIQENTEYKDKINELDHIVLQLQEKNKKIKDELGKVFNLSLNNDQQLNENIPVIDSSQEEADGSAESPMFTFIQSMKQNIKERCDEIVELKEQLSKSSQIVKMLQKERKEIISAIYPELFDSNDKNKLSDQLHELKQQIEIENDFINSLLNDEIDTKELALPIQPSKIMLDRINKIKNDLKEKTHYYKLQKTELNELNSKYIEKSNENQKLIMERNEIFEILGLASHESIPLKNKVLELQKELQNIMIENEKLTFEQNEAQKVLGPNTEGAALASQIISAITKNTQENNKRSMEIESQISELNKQIEDLKKENETFHAEHDSIANIIHSTDGKSAIPLDFESSNSPLLNEILNKIHLVNDQGQKIECLCTQLNKANNTIKKLGKERSSIMESLYGTSSQLERTSSSPLFNQLDKISSRIDLQSIVMNKAMSDADLLEGESNLSPNKKRKVRFSERPHDIVSSAIVKLRNQLNDVLSQSLEKDIVIDQLQEEIFKLTGKYCEINLETLGSYIPNRSKSLEQDKILVKRQNKSSIPNHNNNLKQHSLLNFDGEIHDDDQTAVSQDNQNLKQKQQQQRIKIATKLEKIIIADIEDTDSENIVLTSKLGGLKAKINEVAELAQQISKLNFRIGQMVPKPHFDKLVYENQLLSEEIRLKDEKDKEIAHSLSNLNSDHQLPSISKPEEMIHAIQIIQDTLINSQKQNELLSKDMMEKDKMIEEFKQMQEKMNNLFDDDHNVLESLDEDHNSTRMNHLFTKIKAMKENNDNASEFEAKIYSLNQSLESVNEKLHQKEEECKSAQKEAKSLLNLMNEKEKQIQIQNEEIGNKSLLINQKEKEIQLIKQEAKQKDIEIGNERKELELKAKDIQQKAEDVENQTKEIAKKLKETQRKVKEIEQKEMKIENEKKEIQQKEKQIESRNKELIEKDKELNTERANITVQNSQLKVNNMEQLNQITQLKEKLESIFSQLPEQERNSIPSYIRKIKQKNKKLKEKMKRITITHLDFSVSSILDVFHNDLTNFDMNNAQYPLPENETGADWETLLKEHFLVREICDCNESIPLEVICQLPIALRVKKLYDKAKLMTNDSSSKEMAVEEMRKLLNSALFENEKITMEHQKLSSIINEMLDNGSEMSPLTDRVNTLQNEYNKIKQINFDMMNDNANLNMKIDKLNQELIDTKKLISAQGKVIVATKKEQHNIASLIGLNYIPLANDDDDDDDGDGDGENDIKETTLVKCLRRYKEGYDTLKTHINDKNEENEHQMNEMIHENQKLNEQLNDQAESQKNAIKAINDIMGIKEDESSIDSDTDKYKSIISNFIMLKQSHESTKQELQQAQKKIRSLSDEHNILLSSISDSNPNTSYNEEANFNGFLKSIESMKKENQELRQKYHELESILQVKPNENVFTKVKELQILQKEMNEYKQINEIARKLLQGDNDIEIPNTLLENTSLPNLLTLINSAKELQNFSTSKILDQSSNNYKENTLLSIKEKLVLLELDVEATKQKNEELNQALKIGEEENSQLKSKIAFLSQEKSEVAKLFNLDSTPETLNMPEVIRNRYILLKKSQSPSNNETEYDYQVDTNFNEKIRSDTSTNESTKYENLSDKDIRIIELERKIQSLLKERELNHDKLSFDSSGYNYTKFTNGTFENQRKKKISKAKNDNHHIDEVCDYEEEEEGIDNNHIKNDQKGKPIKFDDLLSENKQMKKELLQKAKEIKELQQNPTIDKIESVKSALLTLLKTNGNNEAIINEVENILNSIDKNSLQNNQDQLININNLNDFNNLLNEISMKVVPDFDMNSPAHEKISAVIRHLDNHIQLQKNDIENHDGNEEDRVKNLNSLDYILQQMKIVKTTDVFGSSNSKSSNSISDSIRRLKQISLELDSINLRKPRDGNQSNNSEVMSKVSKVIAMMMKALTETAKINSTFDVSIDSEESIKKVQQEFNKCCATIKRNFATTTAQQKHFKKREEDLESRIKRLEEIKLKYKEERNKDKHEIEKMRETCKKLMRKISKEQEGSASTIKFLFEFCPTIESSVSKESSFTEIIRVFVSEYGKKILTQAGTQFAHTLMNLSHANDKLNSRIDQLVQKVEELHYEILTNRQ